MVDTADEDLRDLQESKEYVNALVACHLEELKAKSALERGRVLFFKA